METRLGRTRHRQGSAALHFSTDANSAVTEFVVFSKTPLAIVFCFQVCRDGARAIRSLPASSKASLGWAATSPGSRAEVQRWPVKVPATSDP